MTLEAVRRLEPFAPLENYRFIGFANRHFNEHVLAHRELGIKKAAAIEMRPGDATRARFNRPLRGLTVWENGVRSLNRIPFELPTVMLLEYPGRLGKSALVAADLFAQRCKSGSFVGITLSADPLVRAGQIEDPKARARIEKLRAKLGTKYVPEDRGPEDYEGSGTAGQFRKILRRRIKRTIEARNNYLGEEQKMRWKQVLLFSYEEIGARMGVGVVFYSWADRRRVRQADFSSLGFYAPRATPFVINVPNVSLREMGEMNRRLPAEQLDWQHLTAFERRQYARIYRYLGG